MDEKLMAALREAGVDIEGALNRFSGNGALYERFLRKFPADDSFGRIGPALAKENWPEALSAAHTLKGVSGNLGMDRLFQACSNMVTLLRQQNWAQAAASYPQVEDAYGLITRALGGEAT